MFPAKPPAPATKNNAASVDPLTPCTAFIIGAMKLMNALPPTLVNAVAAVSQRKAGERITSNQRAG